MKKILLLLFMVAMSCGMSAQIRFGVKAGANLYNISDSGDNHSPLTAFNAGVVLEFPLSEQLALQPELIYSLQGQKFKTDNYSSRSLLSYLNLPVMVKYSVLKALTVEAGPQLGYVIDANDKQKSYGTESTVNLKSGLKKFDFGLCVGATYMFSANLGLQARYNLGLTQLYKDVTGSNRGAALDVIYLF